MKTAGIFCMCVALLLCGRTPGAAQTRQELLRSVRAPGVVPVGDSLFMDEAEVANLHWLEYLHFLRKDSSETVYRSQLPDTTALTHYLLTEADTADRYMPYYFRYPGFRYFPVVGITYQQALKYCRWRTAKVREGYLQSAEFKRKHKQLLELYEVTVTFRLPTVTEWETAAAGGLSPLEAPFGRVRPPVPGTTAYKQLRIRRPAEYAACLHKSDVHLPAGESLFRMEFNVREKAYVSGSVTPFRCNDVENSHVRLLDGFEITAYIYSRPPNAFGLYNMIGNASELTATPGIAKGGSFENSILDFTLKTNFPYDGPQEWLGFRCACDVKLVRKAGTKLP